MCHLHFESCAVSLSRCGTLATGQVFVTRVRVGRGAVAAVQSLLSVQVFVTRVRGIAVVQSLLSVQASVNRIREVAVVQSLL